MTQDAVRFVNDESSVTLGVTSEYKEQLVPGETYSVHYGKRTKMLTDYTR